VLQIARDKLVSLGTPVGKLTHSGKFRLTIGALDVLSRYAKHKVCAAAGCGSLTIQSETEVTHEIPQVPRTVRHPAGNRCLNTPRR
jgi:hypothetical protein